MYIILNFTVLIVKELYKVMNYYFLMVCVLKKNIIPIYIVLELLKFFICYVLSQNVWNHNKITFLKKGTKKRQVYAPKEDLQKRNLAQNINTFVLIWQYKMYEITTNLSLYKKDKKFVFSTKVVISKKCANCKNKYFELYSINS